MRNSVIALITYLISSNLPWRVATETGFSTSMTPVARSLRKYIGQYRAVHACMHGWCLGGEITFQKTRDAEDLYQKAQRKEPV